MGRGKRKGRERNTRRKKREGRERIGVSDRRKRREKERRGEERRGEQKRGEERNFILKLRPACHIHVPSPPSKWGKTENLKRCPRTGLPAACN